MNIVLKLIGIFYVLYQIKDFYWQGGFSNPIALPLFRMLMVFFLQSILPENIFNFIGEIKIYLQYIENLRKLRTNGKFKTYEDDYESTAPKANLKNRSSSKNRRNNFSFI